MAQTQQHTKVDIFDLLREADPVMNQNGSLVWRNKDGRIHRDYDRPAFIWADGTRFWYQNDQIHRDNDMPAIIRNDGQKFWYEHGDFIK